MLRRRSHLYHFARALVSRFLERREAKSGGMATNIGVHFFDLLGICLAASSELAHLRDRERAAGYLDCGRARSGWFLSVDRRDLPQASADGRQLLTVDLDRAISSCCRSRSPAEGRAGRRTETSVSVRDRIRGIRQPVRVHADGRCSDEADQTDAPTDRKNAHRCWSRCLRIWPRRLSTKCDTSARAK